MKLKLDKTYIHYDFPVIFSALNEDNNIFMCLFSEETDSHLRYLCVPISQTVLTELEYNKRDIRSIFVNPKKVFNLLLNAQSEEPMDTVEISEDITSFLPEKGLFIGEPQGEYSTLYQDAQELPAFIPPAMDTDNSVSVQYNSMPNSTFSTETNVAVFLVKETDLVFDRGLLWPMAA
jgi:hypothetical protein